MPQNEKNAQNLQDLKISSTSQTNSVSDTHTHTPQRVFYPDFLRVFAIFAVIVLHVAASQWGISSTTYEWQIFNLYNGLVRWCVPVFVMVSGMFLLDFKRYSESVSENFNQILKKNIFRMIIVLIFWSIIYAFSFDISKFALNFFASVFRPSYYHLWFLYLIIGLYILAPFLQVLVRNLSKKDFEILLIILIIFGPCFEFLNVFMRYFLEKEIYFPIPEFNGYILYFLAGFYFANFKILNATKKKIYIFAIVFLVVSIVLNSTFAINDELSRYGKQYFYSNKIVKLNTALVTFAIFIYAKDFFEKYQFSDKFYKFTTKLSALSFGIYLIHPAILSILGKFHITSTTLNPIIMVPLLSLAVFAISALLAFILSKIPILRKVV